MVTNTSFKNIASRVLLLFLVLCLTGVAELNAATMETQRGPVKPGRVISREAPQIENRVHDVGNIWLNITNYGYLGNDSPAQGVEDPCTGEWAPQLEFPGGTGIQYLYQSGLWIGATITEEGFEYPRVSVGLDGWQRNREMYPGPEPGNGIIERTTRANAVNCLGDYIFDSLAVSEQDFIATYTDTASLDESGNLLTDDFDGPHVPLGIKVTQKSYAWSYNYARDFIIVDYEIENIADNFLKNLYIGLYVDADVGHANVNNHHTDDICGFTKTFSFLPAGQADSVTLTINSAWIADNDGRPPTESQGSNFTCPGVTGTRVVRAPNPKLRTSFNWWISNGNVDLDFGPAWDDDGSVGDWTATLGTPEGDSRKYFVLSNREFDYDQIRVDDWDWIQENPQEFSNRFDPEGTPPYETHDWRQPDASDPSDLADGYDTRYLLSWGPLGIFDYIDDNGNRVYRLNPGEKFSMTVAIVAGENFHDRNNAQVSNTNIDQSKFVLYDFQYNADWAAKVYDNPMIDTNGDTWFGEDVGSDLVYSENIGDTVQYIDRLGQQFFAVYPGPDEDGTERDGLLSAAEDSCPRPADFDYTQLNELFDPGDGIPDFQGPPPPPVPILTYESTEDSLFLIWEPNSEAEDYTDPFSRQQDFEGFRIYVSNTGLENEFSFLAEYDKKNKAYYSLRDSLMTIPYSLEVADTLPDMLTPRQAQLILNKDFRENGYLENVGQNIGLDQIKVITGYDNDGNEIYHYRFGVKANPMIPRYYSVTAYDYGDPVSGTEPLETARSANAIYAAPSGTDRKKPGVVPNPYRADQDYTETHMNLIFEGDVTSVSWENRNDGTTDFFPQTDRRIYFYNLPEECLVRIYTVSGDLVQIIDHNVYGNRISNWTSPHAEAWDLNSRNSQQVVSGLYLFSVEDMTPENKGNIDVGKFVIIR